VRDTTVSGPARRYLSGALDIQQFTLPIRAELVCAMFAAVNRAFASKKLERVALMFGRITE
jgi:hypothetical protein